MPLKLVRYMVLFCMVLSQVASYAQNTTISKKLAELKSKNNLTEWLYLRIDYVTANPQQLPLLLTTQKEAWRQPSTLEERIAWLTLLSTQGYDQLQTGDILSSINYYEEAYAFFYKYKVAQFDAVEYIFKPLGNNYTRLGDYERAVFIQQKMVDRLNIFEDADNMASIYSNMAISYYTMGNYAAAQNCIAKGQKLTKDPGVNFRLQNVLADILNDQNRLLDAREILQKNIKAQKSTNGQNAYSLLGAFITLGNIESKDHRLRCRHCLLR